ncbi:MAG: hypothetical protein NTY17_00825, partial [Planctomycetia bacterium]|nr:hypothetical protein [Planctomycetia bacterium]
MSRRSLFSDRNSLSRRVLGMMSSLFRRKWAAAVRSIRRTRLARRLTELADEVRGAVAASAASATKLTNTHLLTLTPAEFLERRAVMDVGAGMINPLTGAPGTTLGIWIDDVNDYGFGGSGARNAWVQQDAQGAVRVSTNQDFSDAGLDTVEGQDGTTSWTGVSNVVVFRTNSLLAGTTATFPTAAVNSSAGWVSLTNTLSGFTNTAINVTVQNGTFGGFSNQTLGVNNNSRARASVSSLTLAVGAPGAITNGSTGLFNNGTYSTVPVTGHGGTAATATVVVANNNITSITITSGGSGFTNTTGLDVSGGGIGGTANISTTGSINAVRIDYSGRGYFSTADLVVGGTVIGQAAPNLTSQTASTSFNVYSTSNNFSFPLTIANASTSPSTVSLTGIGAAVSIGNPNANVLGTAPFNYITPSPSTFPDSVTLTGNVSTAGGSLTIYSKNDISILTPLTVGAFTAETWTGGRDISIQGGTVNASTISLRARDPSGSIRIGSPINATGNVSLIAGNAIDLASTVNATGLFAQSANAINAVRAINTSTGSGGVQLVSDKKGVSVFANVTASSSGDVILQAPNASSGVVAITGTVTGRSLSLQEGVASADYVLRTNVSGFSAAGLYSNITLINGKSLTIGTSPVNLYSDSFTVQTKGSLGMTGSINALAAGGANIFLQAVDNVTLSGGISSNNRTLEVVSTSGMIKATTLLNMGTNSLVDLTAGTGIDLGDNIRASNVSAMTTTGNINMVSSSSTDFNVLNAITAGAGSVAINSTSGNLVIAGNVSTAAGDIVLRSTSATVNVLPTATVEAATSGSISLIADQATNGVYINAPIRTSGSGTVTLASNNLSGGIIGNGVNAIISTGTLNVTAAQSPTILLSPNALFDSLAACITGTSRPLLVTHTGALNLVGVSTNNGSITITADSLTVSRPLNAVANAVALTASDGGVLASNLVAGNSLVVSAQNASSFSNLGVACLTASVTAANESFSAVSSRAVAVGAGNVTTNGGDISLTLNSGSLNLLGSINAAVGGGGLGNVTLRVPTVITGTGTVTASLFDWQAANQPTDANYNFSSLRANVTGAGNGLVVNRSTDLSVLNATTTSGSITLNLVGAPANLSINGAINAGSGANNVLINVANGAVLSDSNGLITANVVTLRNTDGNATLFTNATTLTTNVTNGLLTVTESNGLRAANVNATGGVSITMLAGDLNRTGAINATTLSNVTLFAPNSNIVGNGPITALGLDWTAQTAPNITTATATYSVLSANLNGSGDLNISQANDLQLLNVVTRSGNITVTGGLPFAQVNVSIAGTLRAGATGGQNVTLNTPFGNVQTTGAGQVVANVLSITAQNASTVNTNVGILSANVSGGPTEGLTITEADSLVINSVRTADGNVSINLATGNLTGLPGAGSINAGTGNVTLNTSAGNVTLSNQIVGNVLNVTAQNTSTINANVNILSVNVASGGLTFTQARDLAFNDGNVLVSSGDLVVNVTSGNITGTQNVSASGNITLIAGRGNVTLSAANQVSTSGLLTVNANQASRLNTSVGQLAANITRGGLTVEEADDLIVNASGISANGAISINLATGNLTGTGIVNSTGSGSGITLNASAGNVTLAAVAGQINAAILGVTAQDTTQLNTTVGTINASISSGNLTVVETNGLIVDLTGITTAGDVSINVVAGNLTGSGTTLSAGAGLANATLVANAGAINLSAGNQVVADVVTLSANNSSNVNTTAATLIASIRGAGQTLSVTETDDLAIGLNSSTNVTTTNGALTINAGGDITGSGFVSTNGSTANVTLIAGSNTVQGGVTLNASPSQVVGNVLSVTALNSSNINTSVQQLGANITGTALESLTVVQTGTLKIAAANVSTAGGTVDLTVASGNLVTATGANGVINATGGSVVLTATAGNVSLTNANQIVSGNLTLTNINKLTAAVTSGGLTVNEYDALNLSGSVSAAGNIVLNSATAGITGAGATLNAGASNVTLNTSSGAVTLSAGNQIIANALNIRAQNSSTVNTSVSTICAAILTQGETLDVTESNGLQIGAGNVTANGSVNITLTAGTLNGTGVINAASGNVSLQLQGTGDINLAGGNRIIAATLAATASQGNVDLGTRVANLSAGSQSNGRINITQNGNLFIDTAGLQASNGTIVLNVVTGNLVFNNNSELLAGQVGDAWISAPAGSITANGVGVQVTGDQLTILAQNSSNINTSITQLEGRITGANQSLTIDEINDLSQSTNNGGLVIGPNGISTNGGDININVASADLTVATQIGFYNLTGTGVINAANGVAGIGNVTLNVASGVASSGSITLNALPFQVVANTLNVMAGNSSSLNTSVTNLTANITAGSLTIVEGNGLVIDPANVTATGNINITATTG